jgi:hypothetical protein
VGVTAYRVYRRKSNEGFALVAVPSAPTYRDEQVGPGTDYIYEVSSVRAGLEGSRSEAVFARLNDPELLTPDVAPDFGLISTVFQYSCIYRHANGLAPAFVNTVVDSVQLYPMTKVGSGSNWVGGETFRATANLAPGGHTFYVTAVASDGSSSRNPVQGFVFGGPVVLDSAAVAP